MYMMILRFDFDVLTKINDFLHIAEINGIDKDFIQGKYV